LAKILLIMKLVLVFLGIALQLLGLVELKSPTKFPLFVLIVIGLLFILGYFLRVIPLFFTTRHFPIFLLLATTL
jgi:hypothetical protein